MERKFRWLVEPVLGKSRADRLVDLLAGFQETGSVAQLSELLERG
jgi:hypothetical protein